jgi:hypothetical protein
MTGDDTGARLDEDSPLSAEESLALIERQEPVIHRQLGVNVALFYGPWGGLPARLRIGVLDLPIRCSFAVAGRCGRGDHRRAVRRRRRRVRGERDAGRTRGPRSVPGGRGDVWLGLDPGFLRPGRGQHRGNQAGSTRRCSDTVVVGKLPAAGRVLYHAGGALWQDRFQYGLGVWMLVTGAGSVLAGVPGNFAVLALAGGGGLLLTAGYFTLRPPRPRA